MELCDIEFETAADVTPDELLEFYQRQCHETTRERTKLRRMIDNTFCMVTARKNGELIGLARGVTDGLSGRLEECKLDPAYQGPGCVTHTDGRIEHDSAGIAKEMARRVIEALRESGVERIDALAYGTEVDFCEELGFRKRPGLTVMELVTAAPELASSVAAAGQVG
ncbi:MAG: GNAT family N-acetyltransferase [Planctomycetes bacterium]|nr:GNAT family N-acetyltransferase [Planctomycetota bacterium]